MMMQIGMALLYMVAICVITKGSSRGEQIQVYALTALTLLTERFLHHIDMKSSVSSSVTSSSLHTHEMFLGEFLSPSSTLYALMAICFLVLSCLHNGGTIERFIVWKIVDGNDDEYLADESFPFLHQDDENDERTQVQMQQRNAKRKHVLIKYFENSRHLQVLRETDFKRPSHGITQERIHTATTETKIIFHENDKSVTVAESLEGSRISHCDCPICLETFQPSDRILWSQNNNCTHAFHMSCLVEYFLIQLDHGEDATCPCCRRSFCTDLQNDIEKTMIDLDCSQF